MTSLQRIQAIHGKAAREIETPIPGIDPKWKRNGIMIMFTRPQLKALAVVLRQAATKQP
jgi:hypothetical protein